MGERVPEGRVSDAPCNYPSRKKFCSFSESWQESGPTPWKPNRGEHSAANEVGVNMKKVLSQVIWVIVALLGAWAYYTLAVRRSEHISSAYLLIAALCSYAI